MQAFGLLTLGILVLVLAEIEAASSNPCSQFSDPNRQAFCSSDNRPLIDAAEESG